jgi:hypothetical protein
MTDKTTQIVYTGRFINDEKKLNEVFRVVDESGELGKTLAFSKSKNITGYRVGHVYQIKHSGAAYAFNTTVWQEEYHDTEQVNKWQAVYQAERAALGAKATERKYAKNDSALIRSITEIRNVYQSLPHSQRLGFETWILSKLRSR